jgi:hypothetical protein
MDGSRAGGGPASAARRGHLSAAARGSAVCDNVGFVPTFFAGRKEHRSRSSARLGFRVIAARHC